jgi:hypothetical protein
MSAAHKSRLTFQMVRTACAPVQQLRPEAQIERCEGRILESRKDRTLERGGERKKNWQGHCASQNRLHSCTGAQFR